MCGIVGAVAQRDVLDILLAGLKRLEYRGYDSAGVAIIDPDQQIHRMRTQGKVSQLCDLCAQQTLPGSTGIAHTRWATHGVPSEHNAHPHMSGDNIAVVHNGIIENYEQLRAELQKQGYTFNSETDTEIIAHYIHWQLQQNNDMLAAIRATVSQLQGAFALGIIHNKEPDRLFAVRYGSPLVLGVGIGENFLASDQLALLPVTRQFIYLEEGDIADIRRDNITVYDHQGKEVKREQRQSEVGYETSDRGHYRHYMQKEIFEQPLAIQNTIAGRISKTRILDELLSQQNSAILANIKRVQIVACGTSYHAALVARYWLEAIAGIACRVEIASEFRYRQNVVEADTLFVTISQSGETADTLAALRSAKQQTYAANLTISNTPESSLVRESDLALMTYAGTEIGVASTKAFTTQLTALLMLTLVLGRKQNITAEREQQLVTAINALPQQAEAVLGLDEHIQQLSRHFIDKEHALFLGRGLHFPIALEGALKLKEISYIHAEAYPAGELKHGPLALVDKEMPVIAIAPNDELLEKLKSNLAEVRARGGRLYVFAEQNFTMQADDNVDIIAMPDIHRVLAPILYTIPLQLLSYHVAVLKGTDVDQPRNLAKSVTVE